MTEQSNNPPYASAGVTDMPAGKERQTRTSNFGLDGFNFFMADFQTGFGPFIAIFLASQSWTESSIGLALSVGTLAGMISQLPAGALVDSTSHKRLVAGGGVAGVALAAFLIVFSPTYWPVVVGEIFHGLASSVLPLVIPALSLGVVGHKVLGTRIGRNKRFAAAGNGCAAAVMGTIGTWLGSAAVLWLTFFFTLPAIISLFFIKPSVNAVRTAFVKRGIDWPGLKRLLTDWRLVVFALAVFLFHLSNAAMLPFAAANATHHAGKLANMIVAIAIVVPQGVMVLIAAKVGQFSDRIGRRPILIIGWAALPVRALLFAFLPGPWLLIVWQAISGVSAAAFGIAMPLIAADLTRGTEHFSLCIGLLGVCVMGGGTASTAMAGWIAGALGNTTMFIVLAGAGAAGTLVLWALMPETRSEALHSA